jgi:hypothetical protein
MSYLPPCIHIDVLGGTALFPPISKRLLVILSSFHLTSFTPAGDFNSTTFGFLPGPLTCILSRRCIQLCISLRITVHYCKPLAAPHATPSSLLSEESYIEVLIATTELYFPSWFKAVSSLIAAGDGLLERM